MLSEEGTRLGMWGVEGITHEMVDQESYYGEKPAIKLTIDNRLDYMWNAGQYPRYDKESIRYSGVKDDSVKETDNTEVLLHAANVYEPYYVNHHIPDVIWCENMDVVQAVTDAATLIGDYIKTSDTEFIMGKKDINDDKAWQEYLDGLEAVGLKQYIDNLYTYYGLK